MRLFVALPPLLTALACCGAASAQEFSGAAYAEKLKGYDREAVGAAQAYADTLRLRALVEKSAPYVAQTVRQRIMAANPALAGDQMQAFLDQFTHAMLSQDVDAIDHAAVLTLLETLDAEELQALAAFQRTPAGAKVVRKLPLLVGRLDETMRVMRDYVVPRALQAARAEMLKAGVDVKI